MGELVRIWESKNQWLLQPSLGSCYGAGT